MIFTAVSLLMEARPDLGMSILERVLFLFGPARTPKSPTNQGRNQRPPELGAIQESRKVIQECLEAARSGFAVECQLKPVLKNRSLK